MDGLTARDQAARRLTALISRQPQARDVIEFHTRHKMLLLAHAPLTYAALGRLVAAGDASRDWLAEYQRAFLAALDSPLTLGNDINTLQHLAGHLRGVVSEPERDELARAILDYQQGKVPRTDAVGLLRRHAAEHGVTYLLDQYFLFPVTAD